MTKAGFEFSGSIFPKFPALLAFLLFINFCNGHGQFDRNRTGIVFDSYPQNLTSPTNWAKYSLEDVKTMIRVMAQQFSKISTVTVGAGGVSGEFEPNSTYGKSYSSVFAAEAAAWVNQEDNRTTDPIQMYVGIWLHENPEYRQIEVELALESAAKANKVFNGTVHGFVFSFNDIHTNESSAQTALEFLKGFKTRVPNGNVGARLNCKGINQTHINTSKLVEHQVNIVNSLDFVICESKHQPGRTDPEAVSEFQEIIQELKSIKQTINIMVQTGISAKADNFAELSEQRNNWGKWNKLASHYAFDFWFEEAFDYPWRNAYKNSGHFGWWKLTNDSLVGNVTGYAEKTEATSARGTEKPNNGATRYSVNTEMVVLFGVYLFSLIL